MTDSTIKIYNARYSKLMKLLDFIAVNLFIFAYLKYFFVEPSTGNDSNLLIVFYVQIVPDDFVMQLHRF